MPIPYYHVDSFTSELFAGNPAGVCLVPAFPTDVLMQKIAAENRHSETSFVVARPDGAFDLRWFTPEVEEDLCGHATLAAAFVLALREQDSWPVRFHTRSGLLTVARDGERFEMDFPARPAAPCDPPPELLRALGLDQAQVQRSARDYLVIVEDAEIVRNLQPDIDALAKIPMAHGGPILTAPGSAPIDYVCRYFVPSVGIPEDPATGSIHCTLAPYWADRLGKTEFEARQLSPRGAQMRAAVAGDRVKISGEARLYLAGTIEL
jgi:PhzF family phenazine biosynthesis protein